MVLMEFFVVSFKWNLFFELPVSEYVTTAVFVEGLLTLSNEYEKVKIYEIIKSRKPRGNVGDPFGLKRFFSCINIPDKYLA